MSEEMFLTRGQARDSVVISHVIEGGILLVMVSGPASIDQLIDYAQVHVEVWLENSCVLWDFRKMTFFRINNAAIKLYFEQVGPVRLARLGSKTAYLVDPEQEPLALLAKEYSKLNSAPVDTCSFTIDREAKCWLRS